MTALGWAMPSVLRSGLPETPDDGYFNAFDASRAKVLRKRLQWFCIIAITLLCIGTVGSFEAMTAARGTAKDTGDSVVTIQSNAAMMLLFGSVLAYVAWARPNRARLVKILTLLCVSAMGIGMVFEVVARSARYRVSADPEAVREFVDGMGQSSVLAYGIYFILACVLVPMTVKETARIALASFGVFVIVQATLLKAPWNVAVWLVAYFGALTAPGMAWSWWRYREFDARFQADTLREKYKDLSGDVQELSAELTQARRLHEALFPRPIAHGSAVMSYRYEPMREIGGDFLFVHEGGESGANPALQGALTIVLVDVSGHGIPAALTVNRLHGELQRYFAIDPCASGTCASGACGVGENEHGRPADVLRNLNTYACAALGPQGVFATAFVARISPVSKAIEYASAGHPTAFVRRKDGGIEELSSTATMLGVLPPDAFEVESRELNFSPGDRLLAYTDGAMEARDRAGNLFTAERIRALLRGATLPERANTGKLAPLAELVMGSVAAFRHGKPGDDTLIVEARLGERNTDGTNGAPVQDPMRSASGDRFTRSGAAN